MRQRKTKELKDWKVDLKTADRPTWDKLKALRDELAGNKETAGKKKKEKEEKERPL